MCDDRVAMTTAAAATSVVWWWHLHRVRPAGASGTLCQIVTLSLKMSMKCLRSLQS